MATVSYDYPSINIEYVCTKMGLSPVSGSYERALCNYLGIFTPTVNNSWIQTLYSPVRELFDKLKNQTYTDITIFEFITDAGGLTANILGSYIYIYEGYYFFPDRISRGLYYLDPVTQDFILQESHIITWLSREFITTIKLLALEDYHTQTTASNALADSVISATVAGHTSQLSTISSTLTLLGSPTYSNAPARSLNTAYRISTTKRSKVSYTVAITTALSLLNLNSAGRIFLEISPDNINWTIINSAGISRVLTISISLGLNETSYYNVQGELPVNYYVRLRSTTSGGGTVAFESGQEVIG